MLAPDAIVQTGGVAVMVPEDGTHILPSHVVPTIQEAVAFVL